MKYTNPIPNEGSALDALCRPRNYNLTGNISVLQFEIMKLVPARYIVEKALAEKKISKGTTLIESSSGTFGVALAIVGAHHGLKVRLVTSPIGPVLRWRLESLGAQIDVIEKPSGEAGGIQQDRMNYLKNIVDNSDEYFWTQQHSNPMNPLSYSSMLSGCSSRLSDIDYLICSTGTGGSITGISRKIREINPRVKVIGVDHNLSSLFGPTKGEVSRLCTDSYYPVLGMGADAVPPNLDHTVCDQVHWLPVNEMISAAHELHNNFGAFTGPTGAATYRIAKQVTSEHPDKKVLCVFPDHGVRYMDTVFNRDWLSSYKDCLKPGNCASPKEVSSSTEVAGDWSFLNWNRGTYQDVLGFDYVPLAAKN